MYFIKKKPFRLSLITKLTVDDIHNYEVQYGNIREGAFVVFASDWSQRWDTPTTFYNLDNEGHAHTPGWPIDALKFLVEKRKIAAIGHKTLDTDATQEARSKGFLVAVHYILQQHIWQVEVLNNLPHVPAAGAFIHISFPNLDAVPSFSVRAVAYLPS